MARKLKGYFAVTGNSYKFLGTRKREAEAKYKKMRKDPFIKVDKLVKM